MCTWSILSCVNVILRLSARFPACQVQPGSTCGERWVCRAPWTQVSSCCSGTITVLGTPALVQLPPAAKNESQEALSCRLARLNSSVDQPFQPFLASGPWVG